MTRAVDQLKMMARPNAAWIALICCLLLTWQGLGAIGIADPESVPKQMRWLLISLVPMFAIMLIHPKKIGLFALPFMAVTTALLVLLITPGVPRAIAPTINGARCWINLYFMNLQPAELAKIAVVLVLARYLRYRENYRNLRGLMIPFAIVALPVMLIMMQPDLGSAILFFPALFFMLVAAGAKLRHMSALLGVAVLAVVLTVTAIYTLPDSMQSYVLKPHQRERIVSMISLTMGDTSQNQASNYQQDRAMTLVGSGGASGYGPVRSPLIVELNAVPHDHNDMVFAVICNRWGFWGGLTTLGLYLGFVVSCTVVAGQTKDPFGRLIIIGFVGFVIVQAVINIAQTIGLLPVTGITLPFISYGGSSLLASYAMVGLILNFAWRRPAILARPSFEFDNADAVFQ